MKIKIAARKSALAQIQAHLVADALKKVDPGLSISFDFRESLGDQNQDDPLWKMPEKGVFTEDFLADLKSGKSDIVVHSWKDLPTEARPKTRIAATLERADVRDLLLVHRESWEEVARLGKIEVLSSSPRREHNLKEFLTWALPSPLKEVVFKPVRGNILTRIKKLTEKREGTALVVAKAALDRLLNDQSTDFSDQREDLRAQLKSCQIVVLPKRINPPAAAQGALALEIKDDRKDLIALLEKINHLPSFDACIEERKILAGYGGGCHQKIGIHIQPTSYGKILFLRGESPKKENLERTEILHKSPPSVPARRELAWPLDPGEALNFSRHAIEIKAPPDGSALWISKAEALPNTWKFYKSPVWVAGLETWRKLAARGLWVTGSAEGLGESESPGLDALMPDLNWFKLSHADAPSSPHMTNVATYRLKERSEVPDIRNRTHFFWSSGSAFAVMSERYPNILEAQHACGPGNTAKFIAERIAKDAGDNPADKISRLDIFLDHRDWLKNVVDRTGSS